MSQVKNSLKKGDYVKVYVDNIFRGEACLVDRLKDPVHLKNYEFWRIRFNGMGPNSTEDHWIRPQDKIKMVTVPKPKRGRPRKTGK